jgi:hypothetical protein
MKQSLVDVLIGLGFKHTRDLITIVPLEAFEKLDEALVLKAAQDYDLRLTGVYIPLDAEMKFELINRILELKHGMIIDEVKEIDGREEKGYDLEIMPAGY